MFTDCEPAFGSDTKEVKELREKIRELEERNKQLVEQNRKLKTLNHLSDQLVELYRGLSDDNEYRDKKLAEFINRQKRIFQNKVNHGFNTTNIYQEARYILEETAELMRAIEKNDRENMIEELADIVIFAYGCTEVARLGDLDTKIFEKMTINEKREYKQTSEGDFVKTDNSTYKNNGGH